MIECYRKECKHHCTNSGDPHNDGPFCYEIACRYEPLVPDGYTAEELDHGNPFNAWMYAGAWK